MDNLNSPAYPTNLYNSEGDANGYAHGFTKLEMAALMIVQGMASSEQYLTQSHAEHVAMAKTAVSLGKAVIEEANK